MQIIGVIKRRKQMAYGLTQLQTRNSGKMTLFSVIHLLDVSYNTNIFYHFYSFLETIFLLDGFYKKHKICTLGGWT